MKRPFDNEQRNRYYGKRKGDIVKCDAFDIEEAEVIAYGGGDNNSIIIDYNGKPRSIVAEWCEIIQKVELRNDIPLYKKHLMLAAWQWCDDNNKSLEFLLCYMADAGGVEYEDAVDFIANPGLSRQQWIKSYYSYYKPVK